MELKRRPMLSGKPERILRPWGWFESLGEGAGYRVKRLLLLPGRRLSRQRHLHRCEHWVVVSGEGVLELNGMLVPARPGTTLFIPQQASHRAQGGRESLVIVEVQRGTVLREDDIERLADDFGRCG